MNMDDILLQLGLFWQYPVITEKEFYEQNKNDINYFGFPWATIIDMNVNLEQLLNILKQIIDINKEYYTCCQHIHFRKLEDLWRKLNINILYTPHKIINEDNLGNIKLIACPLYAVNIEDDNRNKIIKESNVLETERKYLYNFIGGYQKGYLTDIRDKIFKIEKKDYNHIINTGEWHFNCNVYGGGQDIKGSLNENMIHKIKTDNYNKGLLESRYTLAPSGSGPNSIRFWEALAAGCIPILLSDTLELPEHELWDDTIIILKENDLDKLELVLSKINKDEEENRRKNCLKLYNYFRKNYRNIKKTIIHYCCGSYYKGDFGGVARYDYHISKVFPNYIHFTGPQQKEEMLIYLKNCINPIIITDNHLSCDIPNKYNIFLVHHGIAQTHSERDPEWSEYWRKLCCEGQKKMLYYRNPNNTKIISISQFCTDEFTKYYNNIYTRYPIYKILHTSELNEQIYKKKWNENPIVLGNWKGYYKGEHLIQNLKQSSISLDTNFIFKTLHTYPKSNKNTKHPIGINSILDNWNKEKQDIYIKSDIFLQLSYHEGNSYATLDALLCGLPIVASNVGLFYKDIPEDCFVKVDWTKNNDVEYIKEKLNYAWRHKEELSKKGREWYLKNCNFNDWKKKMNKLINIY